MEKLELKHLAPYLPYGLKVFSNKIETLIGIESAKVRVREFDLYFPIENCKPILRPLSDLTKEIEHNGEKFVPIEFFVGNDGDDIMNAYNSDKHLETISYNLLKYLFEWKFDIFGLIEKGLAIDFNTLNEGI